MNLVKTSVPKFISEKFKLNEIKSNEVIFAQPRKINSKDYLYKQLDKLSKRNYLSGNGNLAEDSLAILELVKYLRGN